MSTRTVPFPGCLVVLICGGYLAALLVCGWKATDQIGKPDGGFPFGLCTLALIAAPVILLIWSGSKK